MALGVKAKLFKSVNANLYCAPLWVCFSLNLYNRIYVAYNNCLRKMFNLPYSCSASNMFAYANVQNFTSMIRYQCYNIFERILTSENKYIRAIVNSDCYFNSQFFNRWRHLLYT